MRRRGGTVRSLRFLVRDRSLVWALTRRDFTGRYKQTALGLAWAVLMPLTTVTVFALFVQRFAGADTHGVPYVLWAYVGLLPWAFFSSSISTGGTSLLSNQSLLNKLYTRRQIYPVAGVLLAGVDTLISAGVLALLFLVTGVAPAATSYWLPLIALVNVVFVVGATLLVSIVVVYVRDLRTVLPVVLQLGLFATPVVYALDRIPAPYRLPYCILNPTAPMIDSYRRVVLFGRAPDWPLFAAGVAGAVAFLLMGAWAFNRLERGIVDII